MVRRTSVWEIERIRAIVPSFFECGLNYISGARRKFKLDLLNRSEQGFSLRSQSGQSQDVLLKRNRGKSELGTHATQNRQRWHKLTFFNWLDHFTICVAPGPALSWLQPPSERHGIERRSGAHSTDDRWRIEIDPRERLERELTLKEKRFSIPSLRGLTKFNFCTTGSSEHASELQRRYIQAPASLVAKGTAG